MITILKYWRQFGRRYFLLHLLFGVATASLGVLFNLSGIPDQDALPSTPSSLNRKNQGRINVKDLALLREVYSRPAFSINYWQQHALRVVIRNLSFAFSPPAVYQSVQKIGAMERVTLPQIEQLVLPDPRLPYKFKRAILMGNPQRLLLSTLTLDRHQSGIWLAQVQGIRAGPAERR